MKRKLILLLIGIIMLMTGCDADDQESVTLEKVIRPVEVMTAKAESFDDHLNYMGTVGSQNVKKYALKSSGKIKSIFVEAGMEIHNGDPLLELDKEDIQFAVDASKAQLSGSRQQINKADEARDFASETLERTKKLYEEGVVTKIDLDKAQLNYDISQLDYNSAIDNNRKANVDYKQKQNLIENTILEADFDGYVIDVLAESGEMVSAGYPVVVARSDVQVINVGVIQRDLKYIEYGDEVAVKIDDVEVIGNVEKIAQTPDTSTRTYNVEITLPDSGYPLGAVANVEFTSGKKQGVLLPINIIRKDGDDYVFVVNDSVVEKRVIEIEEVHGMDVFAKGVKDGETVVVVGMKNIKHGETVNVIE